MLIASPLLSPDAQTAMLQLELHLLLTSAAALA
jgi:hypothetical protein